jgi:hypothetical protein
VKRAKHAVRTPTETGIPEAIGDLLGCSRGGAVLFAVCRTTFGVACAASAIAVLLTCATAGDPVPPSLATAALTLGGFLCWTSTLRVLPFGRTRQGRWYARRDRSAGFARGQQGGADPSVRPRIIARDGAESAMNAEIEDHAGSHR